MKKRIITPLLAAIVGLVAVFIGTSAFNWHKPYDVTLFYHGPDFTQSEVQDKSNWNTTGESCDEGSDVACGFSVPDMYISGGQLVSNATITAGPGLASSSNFIVTNVSAPGHSTIASSIDNRSN
ncbi:MAG TPA: hypothetical protein VG890_04870 [Puia sp.]|nr:hypothetical protein [Puia sp.]